MLLSCFFIYLHFIAVIPCLDVRSKVSDMDYSNANVSGLVAAEKWASVWPTMGNNIFVTYSVFRASIKV